MPVRSVRTYFHYGMDFTDIGRKLAGADLVVVPGPDWREINPLHPRMAGLRAVENGYALMRPSRMSQSIASDRFGRRLGAVDWFTNPLPTLHVTVPVDGGATFYSRIGDWAAMLCVLGLLFIAGLDVVPPDGRRLRRASKPS